MTGAPKLPPGGQLGLKRVAAVAGTPGDTQYWGIHSTTPGLMGQPPSVLHRLRAALAPRIVVERELAAGGMGIVFVGWDAVLERPVAIKILPPERATAVLAERFLREARTTARFTHPNIVPVYEADVADGIPYYVMALMNGGTLADRLRDGRLPEAETIAVARDVLSALGAMHPQGFIHRDIKPSNIFLEHGSALLGDFGIVAVPHSVDDTLTTPNELPGTPRYMAPEQAAGREATKLSDLYSLGAVLYEASTGHPWDRLHGVEQAEWPGVTRHLRAALTKALRSHPAERWSTGQEFLVSLERPSSTWQAPLGLPSLLVVALLVVVAAVYLHKWGRVTAYDVVVFPYETLGDTSLAGELTRATRSYFEPLPGIRMPPSTEVATAWRASREPTAMRSRTLTPELGATFGVSGFVTRSAGRLEIHGSLVNSLGKPLLDTAVVGDSGDHFALVDSLGGLLVATMGRGLGPLMPGGGIRLSRAAVLEYMKGEEAVEHDAWLAAERHYANALAIDSTFLLAAWRLGNARRWMPLRPTPPFPENFRDLFAQHGRDLPRTDSLLIAAQFAPSGGARFAAYESALASDTANATAMLLYGDELFHRGPLAGRPLEEAARMLARAAAANPRLAPAWEHLTWALIRLGRKEEASRALDSLERTAGRPEESEIFLPEFLRLASTARFSPGKLDPAAGGLLASPKALSLAARGALAFDLPAFELEFGRRLTAPDEATAIDRASGHLAQGVALVALGRPHGALAQLDSAAGLFPEPGEAHQQAAEWRVLLPALGVPGITDAEREEGRRALVTLNDHDTTARAAWALGVDALARGRRGRGRQLAGCRNRAGARGWPARAAARRDERRGSGGFACRPPPLGTGARGGFGRRGAGSVLSWFRVGASEASSCFRICARDSP